MDDYVILEKEYFNLYFDTKAIEKVELTVFIYLTHNLTWVWSNSNWRQSIKKEDFTKYSKVLDETEWAY